MTAQLLSATIATAACVVGAYVIAVANRVGASFTTLGIDIVCAVWIAAISLFVFGVFRWVRFEVGEKKAFVHLLSVLIPVATLSLWAWLTLSGRVISHDAMMATR